MESDKSKTLTFDDIVKAAGDDERAVNFAEGTPNFAPPEFFTSMITRCVKIDSSKPREFFEDNLKNQILIGRR
jgi:hypothetical protein